MIYLDTSALAKKYIRESGSGELKEIMKGDAVIATSILTYAEMMSALARRNKAGDISNAVFQRLAKDFETDWDHFLVVDVHDELLPLARKVITQYCLKAADGLHLASAMWLQHVSRDKFTIIASDVDLLRAAENEKFRVINPQDG